jgi:hypothetical protein
MRTILHILTRPEEDLNRELVAQQRTLPETTVEVVDLTKSAPDYDALVEAIFGADSVEVW